MNLELMALRWLRFEKRCPAALFERSPREVWCGQPDVLGVTESRYLYEIEIKRSFSDFKANNHKPFQVRRNNGCFVKQDPRKFWFLVPHYLADKVLPLVPEWAGLLRGPRDDEPQGLMSVKKAVTIKESMPLSTKECVRLFYKMANQVLSSAETLEHFRNGIENWFCEYEI